MVHTHDKGGRAVVLGGCGDDHLFGAARQVDGGFFRGVVSAGGFNDVLRAAVIPMELGGIALAVYPDLLAVQDQVLAVMLHAALERPENGVIFYLIDHVVQIGVAQVDAADLIAVAAPLHHDPQRHASDPAKTVDANFNRHVTVPPPHILPGVPQVWFQL